MAAAHPQTLQRSDRRVNHHKVGLFARLKIANLLFQPQGARAAEGGVIEGLAGAQAIALQLSYLVGLAQRPQHAEGGPGPDVAADTHPHLVLPAGGQAKQPAAEKQIRGRTEGDCGTGVMQALPLGIIKMDPVSKYAAFAGELIVMIDIQIARMLRPQLFNPGDLLPVFTEMRLQPGVGKLGPQALHRLQQRRRRGGSKARGNGIPQPATLMPAADQPPGLLVALLGGFAQVVGHMAIHHHFPGDQAHIEAQRFAE